MQYAVGRIVIGTLIFTSANIALASPMSDKGTSGNTRYVVETSFSASGKRYTSRFEVDEGENVRVQPEREGMPFAVEFKVYKTDSTKTVKIKAIIKDGDLAVAQPTLISTLGQSSGILIDTEQGPVELSLLVTEIT